MNKGLEEFLEHEDDGVFYIGHASALVRLSGKLILCDPVWNSEPYGEYWIFHPKQIDCDEILDKIDCCVVSHEHQDHWAPHILEKLKSPVIVMGGRPNLVSKLNKYASTRLFPTGWSDITSDIKILFVKHPYNDVDSAYVLTNGKFTFYNGNDCFLDGASLVKLSKSLEERDIRIDVAMVPYAFIHSYPFLLDGVTEEWRENEIWRCSNECVDKALLFKRTIRPKFAFGCGNNLLYAEKNSILNKYLYTPGHAKLESVYASSYFLSGDVVNTFSYPLTISDIPEFKAFPPMDFTGTLTAKGLAILVDKMDKFPKDNKLNYQISINDVCIDLDTDRKFGAWVTGKHSGKKPYIRFKVNKKEFDLWQYGEITFEEVIGTRRFRYERVPNVYDREVIEFYNKWL